MSVKLAYHSALKPEMKGLKDRQYYSADGNVAIKHDINNGVLECFKRADVFHTDTSWTDGYAVFQKRARAEKKTNYFDYVSSIEEVIKELKIPAYFYTGKTAFKIIKPDWTGAVFSAEHKAVLPLAGYNCEPKPFQTVEAVRTFVVSTYNVILDVSCGYGQICLPCFRNKKNFIVSDINGKCIDYISKVYMGAEL